MKLGSRRVYAKLVGIVFGAVFAFAGSQATAMMGGTVMGDTGGSAVSVTGDAGGPVVSMMGDAGGTAVSMMGDDNVMGWTQGYGAFSVDTSADLFVNRMNFETATGHMMAWVDDDGDGIVDYVQDTPWFTGLGIGPFTDTNGDGIHDGFETYDFYMAVGMMNFVDVDGDGLSDNYHMNPFPGEFTLLGVGP